MALLGAGGAAAWFLRDRFFWPEALPHAATDDSGALTLIESRTGLPLIMAGVNGRAVVALIDTGAQVTSLDRALAEELGLEAALTPPLVAMGAGGHRQVAEGVDLALELGAMRFDRVRAAVVNLGPLAQPEIAGVGLVIGQDVLGSVLIELDFGERLAHFTANGAAAIPPGAVAIPAQRRGRGMEARVRVEETVLDLLVDTGSTAGVSLSETMADNVGLMEGREATAQQRIVLGGVSTGRVIPIRGLFVAGRSLGPGEAHIYRDQTAPGFPRGLLGLGVIGQSRLWVDLGAGRLAVDRLGTA